MEDPAAVSSSSDDEGNKHHRKRGGGGTTPTKVKAAPSGGAAQTGGPDQHAPPVGGPAVGIRGGGGKKKLQSAEGTNEPPAAKPPTVPSQSNALPPAAAPPAAPAAQPQPQPVARPSSAGAATPSKGPSREELCDLLAAAASEIKSYKAKLAQVTADNETLRNRLKAANAKASATNASSAASGGGASGEGTTTSGLKQKLLDLSLENHLAVDQMTTLRRRQLELEAVIEAQREELTKVRGRGGPGHGPTSSVAVRDAPPPRRAVSADRTAGKPPSGPVPAVRTSSPVARPSTAAAGGGYASQQQQRSDASNANTSRTSQGSTGSSSPRSVRPYDEMMINRFRRSLAPAPTTEQMGEVVHAMVGQLTKVLRQKGRNLPFTKVAPCVYTYPTTHSQVPLPPGVKGSHPPAVSTKKIHLTVDSGRLVVKCGGGHIDMLEYLERNKVCTSLN